MPDDAAQVPAPPISGSRQGVPRVSARADFRRDAASYAFCQTEFHPESGAWRNHLPLVGRHKNRETGCKKRAERDSAQPGPFPFLRFFRIFGPLGLDRTAAFCCYHPITGRSNAAWLCPAFRKLAPPWGHRGRISRNHLNFIRTSVAVSQNINIFIKKEKFLQSFCNINSKSKNFSN
jgi:hypothetical protein